MFAARARVGAAPSQRPPRPVEDPLPQTIPYTVPHYDPTTFRPRRTHPRTTAAATGFTHRYGTQAWTEEWNGFRYWMAMTPFHGGNEDLENPCILASHDGFAWQEPTG